MSEYNGWEIEGDGDPLPPKVCEMITDTLANMSIAHCDDEGGLMYDELPNEEDIIAEVEKMLPHCTINDEIEYDSVST